jgi:hypothetical protein
VLWLWGTLQMLVQVPGADLRREIVWGMKNG